MGTLLSAIPLEMRELQRWVCAEEGSKRPLKCFERGAASVSDPGTWGTFEQAAEAVGTGARDYAGFVFADDGFVGIDIDGAFGEDGMPTDEAVEAITACRSYTEVSKSGRGIHIVCGGKLPFKGRNNHEGWEIYRDGRYFVLTGRTVCHGEVREAQEGIDLVLREHFADMPREGRGDRGPVIWEPRWEPRGDGRVAVEPAWPDATPGSRHLSMVSYLGRLRGQGCPEDQMLSLALRQNERHVSPPMPEREVAQIVRSVTRYRR